MVATGSRSETPLNGLPANSIDPYALFEALTGRKIDRPAASSKTPSEDYCDLGDMKHELSLLSRESSSDDDPRTKDINVGVINPYALVEAMIGRELDRHSEAAVRVISDVLQTDYDELFDLKHQSVLYAGLKLNEQERRAELLSEKEIRILEEHDLVTPDLSGVQKLSDLEKIGLKGLGDTRIKLARMQNGKLRLVLDAHSVGRTVGNRDITLSINDIATPFRRNSNNDNNDNNKEGRWTPPNSDWQDVYEVFYRRVARRIITDDEDLRVGGRDDNRYFGAAGSRESRHGRHENRFDDPVQGATSNSWFVAALFSVFWANPSVINRRTREQQHSPTDRDSGNGGDDSRRRRERRLSIRFHDKGGRNNNKTETVDVNYEIPINNSSNNPVYCRSSDGFEIWPSLYEKAFAKWITGASSDTDRPDITQTAHGDPVKAMAQLNGREPRYHFTDKSSASDLAGLVRAASVNFKTIHPMVAYTHAADHFYRGSNLVANHAYSVLGWVGQGQRERQYLVLRNPWGVTEPAGLTSYPGLLDRVEPAFWPPAALLDRDGVLAIEASAFKEYFACLGIAK